MPCRIRKATRMHHFNQKSTGLTQRFSGFNHHSGHGQRLSGLIVLTLLISLMVVSCGPRPGDQQDAGSAAGNSGQAEVGIDIGDRAPDLVFESPEGEKISLTSLRGKMVLVDFWAAWCSPCRLENPNLVRIYKKYRDEEFLNGSGFTIYGVSLDSRKEDWVNAIEKDGLIWESHVSDLRGSRSVPAAMYGVMAIPMNFLLDGDGIIVAKGLRGEHLETKLRELRK